MGITNTKYNETISNTYTNIKSAFNDIMESDENKIYLNECMVEEIVNYCSIKLPQFILKVKEKNKDEIRTYIGNITNYPNYIIKNDKISTETSLRKLKINYMSWNNHKEKSYYSVYDIDNNHYSLYSERLYKK